MFYTFIRRQQSKGKQDNLAFHSELIFEVSGIDETYVRDAMWNDINFR